MQIDVIRHEPLTLPLRRILNSFSNSSLEFYSYEGFSSSDIGKNEAYKWNYMVYFFADKNINVLLNKLLFCIIIQISFVRDSSILSGIHRYRVPFVRDRIQLMHLST